MNDNQNTDQTTGHDADHAHEDDTVQRLPEFEAGSELRDFRCRCGFRASEDSRGCQWHTAVQAFWIQGALSRKAPTDVVARLERIEEKVGRFGTITVDANLVAR